MWRPWFYHNPIVNIAVISMYRQSGGEKCRIQDWGKYLTWSLCWKSDFDWKIFWDTTSLTDLTAGSPSDDACIRCWLLPNMYIFLHNQGLCPAIPAEALLARAPKSVPPWAVCIIIGILWQKWSLVDVVWCPCDVTSPHWLKVSYSSGANRVSLVTHVRMRSSCLKLNFNWQIPTCDWLVYNLCMDIN